MPWRSAPYRLAPHDLLSLFSSRTQDHQSNTTWYGMGLTPSTLIKKMFYRLVYSSALRKPILNWSSHFSDDSSCGSSSRTSQHTSGHSIYFFRSQFYKLLIIWLPILCFPQAHPFLLVTRVFAGTITVCSLALRGQGDLAHSCLSGASSGLAFGRERNNFSWVKEGRQPPREEHITI